MITKQLLKKPVIIIVALAITLLLVSSSLTPTFNTGSIVTSGWEIYNQINAMQYPAGVKIGSGDFMGTSTISAPLWIVDDDAYNSGVPTMMIQTSDIRHVDFSGTVIPNNQAARTMTIERESVTYQLDYHIYMYDVTVRTRADYAKLQVVPIAPYFEHETSWPFAGDAGLGNIVTDPDRQGKPFDGGVYMKFAINPWRGPQADTTAVPAGYYMSDAWAGVMNTYVFNKEQGQIANQWGETPMASVDAPIYVKGALDNGAQVPMFEDDGTYGSATQIVNWDPSLNPDTRIQSTVIQYLPVKESAGAYLTRNVIGGATELSPCDVYVKYTLRVDVLQTHEFTLYTGQVVPTLAPPVDYFSWTRGFWDQFADDGWWYYIFLAIVGLMALFIVVRFSRRPRLI